MASAPRNHLALCVQGSVVQESGVACGRVHLQPAARHPFDEPRLTTPSDTRGKRPRYPDATKQQTVWPASGAAAKIVNPPLGALEFLLIGEMLFAGLQRRCSTAGASIVEQQGFDSCVGIADGRHHEHLQPVIDFTVNGDLNLVGHA